MHDESSQSLLLASRGKFDYRYETNLTPLMFSSRCPSVIIISFPHLVQYRVTHAFLSGIISSVHTAPSLTQPGGQTNFIAADFGSLYLSPCQLLSL